ncbi:hypothetical protein ASG81_10785 [Paenibacillus sp. Soil522]|nr:hypothetical protein ASG81_10785 [Paenibacillus sp. Soil522]
MSIVEQSKSAETSSFEVSTDFFLIYAKLEQPAHGQSVAALQLVSIIGKNPANAVSVRDDGQQSIKWSLIYFRIDMAPHC